MKLLEENLGKTFSDMNHSNVLLGQSPKAKEIKVKVNKWDQIKFISSAQYRMKGNMKRKGLAIILAFCFTCNNKKSRLRYATGTLELVT